MCGIVGILTPGRASLRFIDAANRIQRHRGPDGDGKWRSTDGHCALGHRRLAILDLSDAGHQPMVDQALGLTVTFNGEIYNYIELRDRLRVKGHHFHTETDTEVLLHAYSEWGDDCLRELNGMYAFAIWNERTRTLFCARDRFGEKPFMYAWANGAFVFASEAKALSACSGVDLSIDDGVLASYVANGSTWIDAYERTLLRGVKQLLPAHALKARIRDNRVEIERIWEYWNVDVRTRHSYGVDSMTESADTLIELLSDSVRLRLRSDVPVGSCLSGGLDSSAIVALMRRLEPGADLRTFTGRFPGEAVDEGHYAKLVSDACHTQSAEVSPTPARFRDEAAALYWHADFPIGGMSQFAQWCVFNLAKKNGVTVLLDGQGSDEQLGGYGSSITASFLSQLRYEKRWGAFLKERRAAAVASPAAFSWSRLALQSSKLSKLRGALRRATNRSQWSREDLYSADWKSASSAASESDLPLIGEPSNGENGLSKILWHLSFRTMLSSLLRYGDRLSMAHSREVRLPFCDPRIAALTFQLSPELLVGNGEVKRVLRKSIKGLVPDAIVTRKKQGFVPPQEGWLTGPLSDMVESLVDSPGPLREYIDFTKAREIARGSSADRKREVLAIWELLNILAWSQFALDPMRRCEKFDGHDPGEIAPPRAQLGSH